MSTPLNAALIDYDMGNLRSVSKALEKFGLNVQWLKEPSRLDRFDVMVLPGVGSFSIAVKNLKKKKWYSAIQKWISHEKPLIGICLGYQLLFEESEESGNSSMKGLEIFKGKVVRFSKKLNLKIPHMGWNQIRKQSKTILRDVPDNSFFYFVHSYYPCPKDISIVATTTLYGKNFASSIANKNIFACQFHPEKSGSMGLNLLKNILFPI